MSEKNYTAFIFARGGSKGVKDKNIRMVAGKPLIAYSIESALASQYISNVIVSTDSERIANVAKQHGAEILMRPAELAGDKSPELLAWKHAIECNREQLLVHETFISLPATSPLRSTQDIDAAIEKFLRNESDILFGISAAHRNPYLNMVKVNNDDLIEIVNPGSKAVRRQDVPDVYDVTTCVYVGNVEYILSCQSLMEGKVGYVEIPVQRSLDIDTEYDLYLADLMISHPFNLSSD